MSHESLAVQAETQESNFSDFGLPEKLMQSLKRLEFHSPTPIQAAAIPLALMGRDILGSAQTGTGKTGAFSIPLIAKLMEDEDATALVLTPTRELAAQVLTAMKQLIPVPNIKAALLIGGEPMPKQFKQLSARPRLIVGTPGRINDHLKRGSVTLDRVKFLVLDETDRMLDMGFGIQIDEILLHMPQERQTLLFSATLPKDIIKLSAKYMQEYERIAVGSTVAAAPKIRQELVEIKDNEKTDSLLGILEGMEGTTIIFVKTKYATERLAEKLTREGIEAEAIHGDLRQTRRDRIIREFRDKKFQVLVATDIAARGLDVPHIETVINYDLPQCPEDFIHRIGRTARAGAEGVAYSFITPSEKGKWRAIHRLMNPDAPEPRNDNRKGGRDGKPAGGKRPFAKKSGFSGKSSFGDKKPRRFDDKPFAAKSDKPVRSMRVKEDRNADEGFSYSRKPKSDMAKKSFSDKPEREFGEKKFGDRKPRGEFSDRKPSDRKFGDRKSGGDFSEKKFGEKKFGDRKPRGEFSERASSDRAFGDRKSGGDFSEKKFGEKKFGDRKPRGEFSERASSDRKFGEKKSEGGFSGKKFGAKPFAEKSDKKPFKSDRKEGGFGKSSKPKSGGAGFKGSASRGGSAKPSGGKKFARAR